MADAEFRCIYVDELPAIASAMRLLLPDVGVVTFDGEMGAGKTTLIKALCASFGVNEAVSSPTYALVNEYQTSAGRRIYHFDLYRLNDPLEALSFGIEEYFADDALSFIEWPERLGAFLPNDHIRISIEDQEGERRITLHE